MPVNVKLSFWYDKIGDWYFAYEKIFYDAKQDYMLLCNGAHEIRNKQTWIQEFVIHLPTRIVSFIDDTEKVAYAEELLGNLEVLFYKFKYTTWPGKVCRLTLYCNLSCCNHSAERLAEISKPS